MLDFLITSEFNKNPPNQSMIIELFPTQARNVRPTINNDITSTSRINIQQNLLSTQVSEFPESLGTNLGEENIATENGVES